MSKTAVPCLLCGQTVVSFRGRATSGGAIRGNRKLSPPITGQFLLMGNLATPVSTVRTVNPAASTKPAGRILVVEDDPAVQKALRRLFETEGYAVETQSDGRSALDSFQSSAPAAVVLDLRLPKVSGRDVCKEIKAMAPTLPIIVLSAASDVSDKVLLLE